ncbi:TIR-like protein FxsC [Streptomyces sp. NPDC002677]|uniref:TIR-like protein FxsC n=1 Tax=Streptomyces sp. NPDC002677 TaxID=3154774 RepID=UPI00332D144E
MPEEHPTESPDPLERVLVALGAAAPDLDGIAMAEALWLAARMSAGPTDPPAGSPPERPPAARPEPPSVTRATADGPGTVPAREPHRPLHERLTGADVRITGSVVSAPPGAGLPLVAEVTRALRPWKRPWPRGRRAALDIEATVDGYARSGELIPVFRPAPERWFGLVLVVDRSPAMRVWQEVIDDITSVLDRLGAFRTLHVRELGFGREGPELRDGLGRVTGPGELRSPDARRLVIVVSDCAAPGWREPEIWRRIRSWSLTTPVALLNPLPPKLWRRTALDLPSVRVRPGAPGSDNPHLAFELPLLLPEIDSSGAGAGGWLPLPVLSTSPHSLDRWSRTLMRGEPEGCGAVLVPPDGRPQGRSRRSGDRVTVEGFLRTASPAAVQLAVLCAPFGRLSMGLLHLLREELVPHATLADVAELLTSGLFAIDAERDGPVELVVPEDVRVRLERELTVHELRRMDRALERADRVGRLPAVAYEPRGGGQYPAGERAFAHARRRTLELLGLPADDRPSPTERERAVDIPHGGRSVTDRPYFFLSYARTPAWEPGGGDPDHWIHAFYRDLCNHIYHLTDLPTGASAGFMDREMRSGEGWPEKLSENLATCRVFVPLFSPRYFTSQMCGREWYAFNERILRARAATGDPAGPAIVPALWTRVDAAQLPDSVRHLHIDGAEFGDRYASDGIYGLIKLNRLRDEYEEVVYRLARRIVEVAHTSPLPHSRPRAYENTPSAFRPRGTGPRHIRLIVAAPTRGSVPDDRDLRPYGESAQDWNPYHQESSRPLAAIAEDLVQSLDYRVTVSSFEDEPAHEAEIVSSEPKLSAPSILLLDRWALTDEERRDKLSAFDTHSPPWISMIAPWNRSDAQNHGENGRRLVEETERTLRLITGRGRHSDMRIAVNGVPTLNAFANVLPAVVAHATRQYLRHAEAHPPPGPNLPRPRLTMPGDNRGYDDPGFGEGGES